MLKKAIGMATPYEKWFGLKPDISDFHIFGSHVYVKREKEPGKQVRRPTKKIRDVIEGLGEGTNELRHLTASLGQVTGEIESDPLSVAEAMQ